MGRRLAPYALASYVTFWLHRMLAAALLVVSVAAGGAAAGLDVTPVLVNGVVVDPAHSGSQLSPSSGMQFWFVKLRGPTQDEWLDGLKGVGLTVLQYYPHNSYLVWGDPAQVGSSQDQAGVAYALHLPVELKTTEELRKRSGRIANVDVMFYNDGGIEGTLQQLRAAGADILQYYPSQPDRVFYNAILTLDRDAVDAVAEISTVLWLGYQSPGPTLDDEMSSQILAGNYTDGEPSIGYFPWLGSVGVDGTGVVWAVVDTGVDYDHPDLNTRIVGGYSFAGAPVSLPGNDCLGGGHGTHVAGIIGGDASAGFTDADGFFYGLGVAPGYSVFAMNSLCGSSWPPAGGWQEHSKRAVLGGAVGANNSWTTGEGIHGYQASERTHDIMVRDGNFDTTTVAEPLIEVFSAGDLGSSGLSAPKQAKNLIVVGVSRNYRSGRINGVPSYSSRGPTVDGRWAPTVVAPGEQISSARRLEGASQCTSTIAGTSGHYAWCSGSSMSAAQASGALALLTEWWRNRTGQGSAPSPALAKALLVNSAIDLPGGLTGPIPNVHEGWGRIHLSPLLEPTVSFVIQEQGPIFSDSGESNSIEVGVVDPGQPLKVSLAWSDAPGAVGANPALVNDLDLEVVTNGVTYRGNVFSAGWSTPGGTADAINNLENVYVEAAGLTAVIKVIATNIAGDGVPHVGDETDQDFALVCSNCSDTPDFLLSATPPQGGVCVPADGVYQVGVWSVAGFSDPVTLSASGHPAGTTATFDPSVVDPPGTSTLTIGNLGTVPLGSHIVGITGTSTTPLKQVDVPLDLFEAAPPAPVLLMPSEGELGSDRQPTFVWGAVSQATDYLLEIATDPGFPSVVYRANETETSHASSVILEPLTTYFWRVTAQNACGSAPSAIRSFWTMGPGLACNRSAVTFEEGIPSNWTVVDNTAGAGIAWTLVSDSACGIANLTDGFGEAACADGEPPSYDTELVSNAFDLAAYDTVTLDARTYHQRFASPPTTQFDLDVWDGNSWVNLFTWDTDVNPRDISVDLTPFTGLPEVLARFRYSGADGGYAQVDDVKLTCDCDPITDVSGQLISDQGSFSACRTLTAGDFEIRGPGGVVTFRAGLSAVLQNGFVVESDASFTVVNDPGLVP